MDDDDGDFSLNTAARSRLSSLFHGDNPSGDVNQALTFTAPKQPKKNENPPSSSETYKLLTAAAVHCYKFKDGSYVNQGKLGCAILGLHENFSYKFLLYKGKQVQVTACTIVSSFKFHLQPNNYVNFFDEKNENWSINFESEMALTEFSKQVALAKSNSEGKTKSLLVIQDLVLGEGPSVDIGDAVEVRYSCWKLTNYSFGQLLDSNLKSESSFRFRLGKTKIIKGLSDGLVGARKGSKRLLIIPPNLIAEGSTPSVPTNTTVIFEILVTKVKVSSESSHSPSPIKLPETVSEKKPRSSISIEENVRLRGASISEQLSQSPKKDKAQIISRMAKMGTATLPFQGAVAVHVSSESENEEEIPSEEPVVHPNSSRTASPKSFSKSNSRKNSDSSSVSQPIQMQIVQPQLVPENIGLQSTQQSSQMAQTSQASLPTQQAFVAPSPTMPYSTYHPAFPAQFPMHRMPGMMSASMADTHLPMLITETWGQNTEVRLSLSKITDKVDTIIQKMDELRQQQGQMPGITQAPFMESAMLVQNIERIVQENKQLKEDNEAKNSKIQSLNEKICDLLQRNQRFFEESNNRLEQRSDTIQAVSVQSQAKLLSLENEKAKLSSDLLDAHSKLALLEEKANKFHTLENQLKQKLQEYEEKIKSQSSDFNAEKESLCISLQQKVENAEKEKELLAKKLTDLDSQYKQLLETKSSEKNESASDTGSELAREEIERLSKEKEELQSLLQELQKKLNISEARVDSQEKKLHELHLGLENSLTWKKKYEVFYERTRAMKDNYEGRMNELLAETKQLRAASGSANFSAEIKKVMNALFKILQGKFEPSASYQGSKVLEVILQSIRVLTFQMVGIKDRASSTSSENEAGFDKTTVNKEDSSNAVETNSSTPQEASTDSLNAPVQQNDSKDSNGSSSTEVLEITDDCGKSDETSNNDENLEANKSVEGTPLKQSECDSNGVDSSSDSSNITQIPDVPKVDETEKFQVTKEVNRASPDNNQHLSSKNDGSGANKVVEGLS